VAELLAFPRQNCPDVLVLGLLQINPPITVLRQELLGKIFKVFLAAHPNSGVILAHAWHSQSIQIKPILMLSMADWYLKAAAEGDSEHSRLSRILDVAQDLKALSLMLSGQPFTFVIDLAVLASRREYLNLEKWLTDKIREHGEIFVAATVKFLTRKIPSIAGPGPLKEEAVPKGSLPVDCLTTVMLCLQDAVKQMPLGPDVAEAIVGMVGVCGALLPRSRPPVAGGGRGGPPGGSGLPGREAGPPGGFGGGPGVAPRGVLPPTGLFPPTKGHSSEALAGLSSQFNSSMQLGSAPGGGIPPATSAGAFSLPGVLGPLVSGPGSPGRMVNTGLQQQQLGPAAVGGTPSPFPPSLAPAPSGGGQGLAPPSLASIGQPPPPRAPMQQAPLSTNPIEQVRSGNLAGIFPEVSGTVSREVEDEANAYFQRIYNHPPNQIGIDEVLELLKKFQTSGVSRETDVFNCMIKNLFEEYKFFPQYPDKELHITAQLFGGIIEHSLVTMVPLGLALRFVLEALRKPTESNMFYFGVAALDRFRGRLKEYPQYCQHVASIPHFKEFPAHLVQWVEHGTLSQEPPSKPSAPVLPPSLAGAPQQQVLSKPRIYSRFILSLDGLRGPHSRS
jgi:CCR4-NOT transcription complex subunit 1